MRTTIELKDEHRSRLLSIAAQRGEKGFSGVVEEAVQAYLDAQVDTARRRRKALAAGGSLSARDARELRARVAAIRRHWR